MFDDLQWNFAMSLPNLSETPDFAFLTYPLPYPNLTGFLSSYSYLAQFTYNVVSSLFAVVQNTSSTASSIDYSNNYVISMNYGWI